MQILDHDTYKIETTRTGDAVIYTTAFGEEPATNAELVPIISKATHSLPPAYGTIGLITGKASLPVSYVLAHHLSHYHKALGVFDPKLNGFVIVVTHDRQYPLGKVI
ncbi:CRISPR-associated protein Csx3 [Sodalinema gerasimenkoae]|uniref:CRISPR-associated protein Csx3 n=1 Tax=Sodalinema gerasimenkoae TaxID=2862348 RepID=UPI00135B8257|nr:CRISPR-associated protein Csx3 [Sodalinema gerasimenkoae]